MWRSCLLLFSTFKELYSLYLFHKDTLKTNISTSTPHSTCRKVCGQNIQKSGIWAVCFSTMTKHLLILCVCVWIYGKEQNHSHSMLALLTRSSAMWLVSFSKTQDGVKGEEI
jgi:hypothetical protein